MSRLCRNHFKRLTFSFFAISVALSVFLFLGFNLGDDSDEMKTEYSQLPENFKDNRGFWTHAKEGAVIFVGAHRFTKAVSGFVYAPDSGEIVDTLQTQLKSGDAMCEAPGGVLFGPPGETHLMTFNGNSLLVRRAVSRCVSAVQLPGLCATGRILFKERLPGRDETLAICTDGEAPTYHLISASGAITPLGAHGATPAGIGRFIATRALEPDTFLTHHSNLPVETAVMIDLRSLIARRVFVPDLAKARPSQGFGAGVVHVMLHEARGGYVVETTGRHLFYVSENNSEMLTKALATGSVRVLAGGCRTLYIERGEDRQSVVTAQICEN